MKTSLKTSWYKICKCGAFPVPIKTSWLKTEVWSNNQSQQCLAVIKVPLNCYFTVSKTQSQTLKAVSLFLRLIGGNVLTADVLHQRKKDIMDGSSRRLSVQWHILLSRRRSLFISSFVGADHVTLPRVENIQGVRAMWGKIVWDDEFNRYSKGSWLKKELDTTTLIRHLKYRHTVVKANKTCCGWAEELLWVSAEEAGNYILLFFSNQPTIMDSCLRQLQELTVSPTSTQSEIDELKTSHIPTNRAWGGKAASEWSEIRTSYTGWLWADGLTRKSMQEEQACD